MSENPLPPKIEPPEQIKMSQTLDFWLGMLGSIVINLIIYVLFTQKIIPNPGSLFWLPWILNMAAILVLLVMRRNNIVGGIMTSYAIGLVIYLCVGFATCFGSFQVT